VSAALLIMLMHSNTTHFNTANNAVMSTAKRLVHKYELP
jgi:hypothetical protein